MRMRLDSISKEYHTNVFLKEGKSQDYLQSVRIAIHNALMTAWGIPKHDCFQIIHEKKIFYVHTDFAQYFFFHKN